MQKRFKESINMWGIDADEGKVLRRKGSTEPSDNRHATVTDPDEWEEIDAAGQPSQTKTEYDAEVERLIALRYSYGKEIEVNRERDTRPERYAAYLAYIEECKRQAREAGINLNHLFNSDNG
jgi:hypothetical protein